MSRRKRYTRNLGRILPTPLPVRATTEWVRFEHEAEPWGVFSYLDHAKRAKPELSREINVELEWFNRMLDAPDHGIDLERFWFKAEAWWYIHHARELTTLVRRAGIPIVERRIARLPGIVRWQDRDQVAVVTFRDTPRVAKTL
ncbi:MAG TPA: hypothetical protein VM261_38735 [Kofleriaceae bacterium]|nr:hypothetical protein [Kofleriaceae bacterium]